MQNSFKASKSSLVLLFFFSRCGSRAAAASKMEGFVIIVNGLVFSFIYDYDIFTIDTHIY